MKYIIVYCKAFSQELRRNIYWLGMWGGERSWVNYLRLNGYVYAIKSSLRFAKNEYCEAKLNALMHKIGVADLAYHIAKRDFNESELQEEIQFLLRETIIKARKG